MPSNVHALPTHKVHGRRRALPLPGFPRADVMSLKKYRDESATNAELEALEGLQRDSHVRLTVNAFGDITYDCHFNPINIERVQDVLMLLLIRARRATLNGPASYQSD